MNVSIDNVLSKVSFDHDCWKWNGRFTKDGYARTCFGSKSNVSAHRVIFEALVGPIAPGLEIDHLCRNRGCVNPMHMEPVTHQTNMDRGIPGHHLRAKTCCPVGHTYGDPQPGHKRTCRACGAAAQAAYKKRLKEARWWPRKERVVRVHCRRGHELSSTNLYFWTDPKSGKRRRYCVACMRIAEANKQQKRIASRSK